MSDDGMFCPYKKSTKREVSYSWISRTEITTERFGWCSEKKCMPTTTAGARCLRRRWRMSKETRFCPFMRKLTREHWRTAQNRAAESYKDRFGKCIGEKCMAYENGRCKRLEREGTQ